MKTAVKKTKKATAKKTAVSAKKKTVAGKNAATPQSKNSAPAEAHSLYLNTTKDDAHSPGHRKMNLKQQAHPASSDAFSHESSAKVKKAPLSSRRVITGAALGKTGRIIES
jgi:hypothetical protein